MEILSQRGDRVAAITIIIISFQRMYNVVTIFHDGVSSRENLIIQGRGRLRVEITHGWKFDARFIRLGAKGSE